MFDGHEQPHSPQQKLNELAQYVGTLFHDLDFQPRILRALQVFAIRYCCPPQTQKTHRKLVGEILATRGIRQGSKKWSDSFGLFVCTWCSPIWRLDTRTSGFTNIKQFVRTTCICNGAQVGLTALSDLDNIFKSFACIGFSINLDMLSCSGCW